MTWYDTKPLMMYFVFIIFDQEINPVLTTSFHFIILYQVKFFLAALKVVIKLQIPSQRCPNHSAVHSQR